MCRITITKNTFIKPPSVGGIASPPVATHGLQRKCAIFEAVPQELKGILCKQTKIATRTLLFSLF